MIEQPLVAYYRVSTARQGRSGIGLEGQRIAVRRYIDACPGRLIGEFTDVKSGLRSDRPEFLRALWLCRVYDAKLVVAHIDRMSRSFVLIADLLESGVDFVAANMPSANRFTIHILAAVAEYELSLMSARLKAAAAVSRARGRKFDSGALVGYRCTPAMLEARSRRIRKLTDERAREFAPLLCALRDQGATIQGIADELTRAGVPTRRNGRKWSHSVVRQMFERLGEPKPKSGCGQKRKHRAVVDLRVPFLLGSMNGLNL